MPSKHKLNKRCLVCDKLLLDTNKTGFCKKHRDICGKNNPFYGKKHSTETIEKIKEKNRDISTSLWKNDTYRNKVICGVSKPRKPEFKNEQSIRIKEWYDNNPNQREIRSCYMKHYWKSGIIIKNNFSVNCSKLELDLFNEVKNLYPNTERRITIRAVSGKYYFPDIVIRDSGIIIEFFGDFWHGNPEIYNENDVVYNNITAGDLWKKDKYRINDMSYFYEDGKEFPSIYKVIVVWESEYKKHKNSILNSIDMDLNWESCAL